VFSRDMVANIESVGAAAGCDLFSTNYPNLEFSKQKRPTFTGRAFFCVLEIRTDWLAPMESVR
jgi:hypothetical protein